MTRSLARGRTELPSTHIAMFRSSSHVAQGLRTPYPQKPVDLAEIANLFSCDRCTTHTRDDSSSNVLKKSEWTAKLFTITTPLGRPLRTDSFGIVPGNRSGNVIIVSADPPERRLCQTRTHPHQPGFHRLSRSACHSPASGPLHLLLP